jgi:hypothetical protein
MGIMELHSRPGHAAPARNGHLLAVLNGRVAIMRSDVDGADLHRRAAIPHVGGHNAYCS